MTYNSYASFLWYDDFWKPRYTICDSAKKILYNELHPLNRQINSIIEDRKQNFSLIRELNIDKNSNQKSI
jgi:hypothetical protein